MNLNKSPTSQLRQTSLKFSIKFLATSINKLAGKCSSGRLTELNQLVSTRLSKYCMSDKTKSVTFLLLGVTYLLLGVSVLFIGVLEKACLAFPGSVSDSLVFHSPTLKTTVLCI